MEYGNECRPFKETRYVEMEFFSSEYKVPWKEIAEKLTSVSILPEIVLQNMQIVLTSAMIWTTFVLSKAWHFPFLSNTLEDLAMGPSARKRLVE